jgi:endonuclease YncB( thermonuclease family)
MAAIKQILCVSFLVLASTCAWSATLSGLVVGVSDGDTVTVLDSAKVQHKIRLSGIDAPEKHQPFGNASKASLSAKLFSRQVEVEYDKSDRYGRLVGKITVDGMDVNLEQVKAGMAWHYKAYQKEQLPEDRLAYARAEEAARLQRLGIWRELEPTPPWEFRRMRSQAIAVP